MTTAGSLRSLVFKLLAVRKEMDLTESVGAKFALVGDVQHAAKAIQALEMEQAIVDDLQRQIQALRAKKLNTEGEMCEST